MSSRAPERLFPHKIAGRWWVYLVGRDNWVKVGITSAPRNRLREHRLAKATWLHLLARGSKTFAFHTERLICERFYGRGTNPRRNREDFNGIAKAEAIVIGRSVVAFVREDLESWEHLDVSRKADTRAWIKFRSGLSESLRRAAEQGA